LSEIYPPAFTASFILRCETSTTQHSSRRDYTLGTYRVSLSLITTTSNCW
jgi:hypothetical protein